MLLEIFVAYRKVKKNLEACQRECFQLALRMWPERGSTYRAIAEWHLRRGDNSAEALALGASGGRERKGRPGPLPGFQGALPGGGFLDPGLGGGGSLA